MALSDLRKHRVPDFQVVDLLPRRTFEEVLLAFFSRSPPSFEDEFRFLFNLQSAHNDLIWSQPVLTFFLIFLSTLTIDILLIIAHVKGELVNICTCLSHNAFHNTTGTRGPCGPSMFSRLRCLSAIGPYDDRHDVVWVRRLVASNIFKLLLLDSVNRKMITIVTR